ncbi:hypothetical protein BCR37DRAFT_92001 [Protomyces lactucae-debilis]|uniref:Uncharacterized protein n=1 Tax=Protomyces lactucae-debilis TaxID=2754530 RepID=A0A1Y2F6B4_PROLT|nr:uncharacterized protein BCR37DRAFT_92001 [Protomyces lactucae-debilis]ORY79448.1 hypothetical protein BCR37DRAFT_92001 [Protomyces lactucae-debilis]
MYPAVFYAICHFASALQVTKPNSKSAVIQNQPFIFNWQTSASDDYKYFVVRWRTAEGTDTHQLDLLLRTKGNPNGLGISMHSSFPEADQNYQFLIHSQGNNESESVLVAASQPFRVVRDEKAAHLFTGLTSSEIAAFVPPDVELEDDMNENPALVAWATTASRVFDEAQDEDVLPPSSTNSSPSPTHTVRLVAHPLRLGKVLLGTSSQGSVTCSISSGLALSALLLQATLFFYQV